MKPVLPWAPARLVEVTRGSNSVVAVVGSSRPADRLLDNAFAIAADDAVPDDIKKRAIAMLCREAFEATAWDVFSSQALAGGQSRAEVEDTWENATSTKRRVALAVDPHDDTAIQKWQAGGSARRAAMMTVTKGIHTGVADYKATVKQARLAIDDLAAIAS